jgi:hypothetical protein
MIMGLFGLQRGCMERREGPARGNTARAGPGGSSGRRGWTGAREVRRLASGWRAAGRAGCVCAVRWLLAGAGPQPWPTGAG